ncbi:hypothetical protein EV121DRAFT_282534 [Schizophyllum commune]
MNGQPSTRRHRLAARALMAPVGANTMPTNPPTPVFDRQHEARATAWQLHPIDISADTHPISDTPSADATPLSANIAAGANPMIAADSNPAHHLLNANPEPTPTGTSVHGFSIMGNPSLTVPALCFLGLGATLVGGFMLYFAIKYACRGVKRLRERRRTGAKDVDVEGQRTEADVLWAQKEVTEKPTSFAVSVGSVQSQAEFTDARAQVWFGRMEGVPASDASLVSKVDMADARQVYPAPGSPLARETFADIASPRPSANTPLRPQVDALPRPSRPALTHSDSVDSPASGRACPPLYGRIRSDSENSRGSAHSHGSARTRVLDSPALSDGMLNSPSPLDSPSTFAGALDSPTLSGGALDSPTLSHAAPTTSTYGSTPLYAHAHAASVDITTATWLLALGLRTSASVTGPVASVVPAGSFVTAAGLSTSASADDARRFSQRTYASETYDWRRTRDSASTWDSRRTRESASTYRTRDSRSSDSTSTFRSYGSMSTFQSFDSASTWESRRERRERSESRASARDSSRTPTRASRGTTPTRTPTRDSQRTPTRDSQRTPMRESHRAPTRTSTGRSRSNSDRSGSGRRSRRSDSKHGSRSEHSRSDSRRSHDSRRSSSCYTSASKHSARSSRRSSSCHNSYVFAPYFILLTPHVVLLASLVAVVEADDAVFARVDPFGVRLILEGRRVRLPRAGKSFAVKASQSGTAIKCSQSAASIEASRGGAAIKSSQSVASICTQMVIDAFPEVPSSSEDEEFGLAYDRSSQATLEEAPAPTTSTTRESSSTADALASVQPASSSTQLPTTSTARVTTRPRAPSTPKTRRATAVVGMPRTPTQRKRAGYSGAKAGDAPLLAMASSMSIVGSAPVSAMGDDFAATREDASTLTKDDALTLTKDDAPTLTTDDVSASAMDDSPGRTPRARTRKENVAPTMKDYFAPRKDEFVPRKDLSVPRKENAVPELAAPRSRSVKARRQAIVAPIRSALAPLRLAHGRAASQDVEVFGRF